MNGMDVEEENLPYQSDEDSLSCSSSILNTPRQERQGKGGDDEKDVSGSDDDDDINVTLLPVNIDASSSRQDHSGSKLDGKLMKQLSGAGKKRFKRLVDSGVEPDEARRLAFIPLEAPNLDPAKRFRNSESSGENPRPKKQVRPSGSKLPMGGKSVQHRLEQCGAGPSGQSKSTEGRNKPSYKEALTSVKVGILPKDYPNTELTFEQLMAIQKAVLSNVIHQRKEKIKPKFGNCLIRPGYLIIICKNQETSDWLKNTISNITPWEGAELVAVDENQIPQPETLIGFFPMSAEDSNEEIFALLESQNDGLVVDSWKIFLRKIINKRHVELTFSVDAVSMKTLKECEFVLDYKFGNAPIRKKLPKKVDTDTMDVEVSESVEANSKTSQTGDDEVNTITNQKVPGTSEVPNTGRTQRQIEEVNSTKRTGERTGDDNMGGNTINQQIPGSSRDQVTVRTLQQRDFRKIEISAGDIQLSKECVTFSGEGVKVPKKQNPNRHVQ